MAYGPFTDIMENLKTQHGQQQHQKHTNFLVHLQKVIATVISSIKKQRQTQTQNKKKKGTHKILAYKMENLCFVVNLRLR